MTSPTEGDDLRCDPESDLIQDHVGPFTRDGWCGGCGDAILIDNIPEP